MPKFNCPCRTLKLDKADTTAKAWRKRQSAFATVNAFGKRHSYFQVVQQGTYSPVTDHDCWRWHLGKWALLWSDWVTNSSQRICGQAHQWSWKLHIKSTFVMPSVRKSRSLGFELNARVLHVGFHCPYFHCRQTFNKNFESIPDDNLGALRMLAKLLSCPGQADGLLSNVKPWCNSYSLPILSVIASKHLVWLTFGSRGILFLL